MEDFSDEFTSMQDAPATNGSFGQRIRNFLWENKNSIFLTGCFAGVLAALVVYMMKQRSELKTVHIKLLETVNKCTELKKAVKELKTAHIKLLEAVNECTELKKAVKELKTVHIKLLEAVNESTELKKAVKEHIFLLIQQKHYFGRRWFVSSDEGAFQKKFELSWEKLRSLITK